MSFDELRDIAKENHDNRAHELHTLTMHPTLRARLRREFPPPASMGSAQYTEALEMSAMRNGLPFMANLGELMGIRIQLDNSLPENVWKLVDPRGNTVKEGVVSEGDE